MNLYIHKHTYILYTNTIYYEQHLVSTALQLYVHVYPHTLPYLTIAQRTSYIYLHSQPYSLIAYYAILDRLSKLCPVCVNLLMLLDETEIRINTTLELLVIVQFNNIYCTYKANDIIITSASKRKKNKEQNENYNKKQKKRKRKTKKQKQKNRIELRCICLIWSCTHLEDP